MPYWIESILFCLILVAIGGSLLIYSIYAKRFLFILVPVYIAFSYLYVFSTPRFMYKTPDWVGSGLLPKKVYINSSRYIKLEFSPLEEKHESIERDYEVYKSRARSKGESWKIERYIFRNVCKDNFLEVELDCSDAISVKESKIVQRQSFMQEKLKFRWDCYFEVSGSHEYMLVVRVINSIGEVAEEFYREMAVKVVQIDHMTQQEVGTLASISSFFAAISVILGIVEVLKN